MIYQKHPDHGRHFAMNAQEAKENIKKGWETVTEDEFYGKKEPRHETDGTMDRIRLIDAYEFKFGKKPNYRMKNETIKAKLDE